MLLDYLKKITSKTKTMDNYSLQLSDKSISIKFERKRIRYLRIHVCRDCIVKVSMPLRFPADKAIDFVEKKKSWIEKHLEKFEAVKNYNIAEKLADGGNLRILGQQYNVIIKKSSLNDIIEQDSNLIIFSKTPDDFSSLQKQYEKYFKTKAQTLFKEIMEDLYPIVGRHNAKFPSLKFKKMKTMWGNCNIRNGTITLNYNLYKTPKECIRYVVLHELTHLLNKNHNAAFYNFIEANMPDWRSCKEKLHYETMKLAF